MALRNFLNFPVIHPFSPSFFWAVGNLPLLAISHGPLRPKCCNISSFTTSSRPIQSHATTRALIPHCNVPDPPTGEEDATIRQIIWASSPMNMKIQAYSAKA